MSTPAEPHPICTPEALAEMYAHARREYPNECCGFVYGARDAPTANRAVACVNIQNELHAMDPKTHERDASMGDLIGTLPQQRHVAQGHGASGDDRRPKTTDGSQKGGLALPVAAEECDRPCVGDHQVDAP